MTPNPAQYSKTQRRLLSTLGGLGVAALAAGAFVLSYDDLRLLALRGGAAHHWAFLYPGMLDGLVVVVILAILTARRSGWFSRTVRWLLLVLLIAGAGAAGVQRTVKGYAVLPDTPVNVGVAVAPWAILVIAVWLWIAMIKHGLGLRARRISSLSRRREAAGAVEAVPATVTDQSIIPGLGPAETRQLPLASAVRELEPVREAAPAAEPLPPPAPSEPEPNPWDAARIDEPQPWEHEEPETAEVPHSEPSDPVPASWLPDSDPAAEDDTQPLRTEASRTGPDEPEPLLPPGRSFLDRAHDEPEESPDEPREEDEPAPQTLAETPMTEQTTEPDENRYRLVARTSLPTDVRLVGGPKKPALSDTHPDGFRLPDTNPDGIPLVSKAHDTRDDGEDEHDGYADERAEDPDAGDDDATPWDTPETAPPFDRFRSGPTPPRG